MFKYTKHVQSNNVDVGEGGKAGKRGLRIRSLSQLQLQPGTSAGSIPAFASAHKLTGFPMHSPPVALQCITHKDGHFQASIGYLVTLTGEAATEQQPQVGFGSRARSFKIAKVQFPNTNLPLGY